jgi:uncharacterized protein YndB with AHSA1/START domain
MARIYFVLVFAALLSSWANAQEPKTGNRLTTETLMTGKVETDRVLRIKKTIQAPANEIFRLWTTTEGVKQFLAPGARIDARLGGEYTIIFFPTLDPNGDSYGTHGARILRFEPGKHLSFEWMTFIGRPIAGASGPPSISIEERNANPLPTWVDLEFIERNGKTDVTLTHHGFRRGQQWDVAYKFFVQNWNKVLTQLQRQIHGEQAKGGE